jgi:pimeloyl-ACP methyl ester carboxylesterase
MTARRKSADLPSTIVALAATIAVSVALSGCTSLQRIIGFEEQSRQARELARIEGQIETEGPPRGVLVVILGRVVEGEEKLVGIDSYVRVNSGSYMFVVSPGRFHVGAYEDRNVNGLLDPGERTVSLKDGEMLEVGSGERAVFDIVLAIGATIEELTEPVDVLAIVERTPEEQREFSLWAFSAQGKICEDLGDTKFGPKSGIRGLWEPMSFLNDELAGIYFLEAYDPDRVPVLFVHGIGGFPQEFSALIEGLDRTRFQAWFYFYPSGFSLEGISDHLKGLLKRMQVKHHIDELAIVGHSMGGLVSRGAILEYKDDTERDDINLFISISTPWGGDPSAKGTENARITLPASFKDMNPSSDFLRWMFYDDEEPDSLRTLPNEVDYHMLVSFRMRRSRNIADDGSVTLASQMRIEAQEEALSIRAWDYGHVDILHSPEAIARMNLLLDERFE